MDKRRRRHCTCETPGRRDPRREVPPAERERPTCPGCEDGDFWVWVNTRTTWAMLDHSKRCAPLHTKLRARDFPGLDQPAVVVERERGKPELVPAEVAAKLPPRKPLVPPAIRGEAVAAVAQIYAASGVEFVSAAVAVCVRGPEGRLHTLTSYPPDLDIAGGSVAANGLASACAEVRDALAVLAARGPEVSE